MDLMRCGQTVSDAWRRARLCAGLACALALTGCHAWNRPTYVPPEFGFLPPPPMSNPVLVTTLDRDFVWDQVVDVVDDYFRIAREERIRLVGDLLTEGKLETFPRGASTLFEPWNHDSVTAYDKLEATIQSMRRTAVVRVMPAAGGFEIEVIVQKELEFVLSPETGAVSLANAAALRNDDSLQRVTNPVGGAQPNMGWIDRGRDPALEQVILAQIQARLGSMVIPQQF